MTELGFFNVREKFDKMSNDVHYLQEDYKKKKQSGVKNCSYCKKALGIETTHNLRTCMNKTMMGKSEFDSWNEGPFKMMYIGLMEVEDLCKNVNLFTFTGKHSHNDESIVEEINDFDDTNDQLLITQEDQSQNEDLAHLLAIRTEKVSEIFATDIETCQEHQSLERHTSPTKLPSIDWSVKKQDGIPGMTNTCALDTMLFLVYYIRNHYEYVMSFVNSCNSTLKSVMRLMDDDMHDMARYLLTKTNTNFAHIKVTDNFFDLDSSIGDWLNVFRSLTTIGIRKGIECTKCNKKVSKQRKIDSINVQLIDKNVVRVLNDFESLVEGKQCGNVDIVLDEDVNEVPVYEKKCSGVEQVKESVAQLPQILTILASEHVECDFMFFDVPMRITFSGCNWKLAAVVIKNQCHFRGIVHRNDNTWVLYDGAKKNKKIFEIDTSVMAIKDIINVHDEDYGIVAILYCKDETINKNNEESTEIDKLATINDTKEVREEDMVMVYDYEHDKYEKDKPTFEEQVEGDIKRAHNYIITQEKSQEVTPTPLSKQKVNEEERPIVNIDVLTQKTDESDNNNEENCESESYESYEEYENQIKKMSGYKLPYATVSVDEEDNRKHIFQNTVKRKPEPLYVGDTIQYNQYIDGFDPKKFVDGIVTMIDREDRTITVDSGYKVQPFFYIRRVIGYDSETKKMKKQNGLIRSVEGYDLVIDTPSIHIGKVKDFSEKCKEKREWLKNKKRETIEKLNLPRDLLR